ncbi:MULTISPECIES: IclR family transcriptional regulator [unclassified Luteococcus]|uniref:IclR family transcriptional regulator n=1 Tax=unclassified Luteococcus TaxID=2639923 RepID=UPI00313D79B7
MTDETPRVEAVDRALLVLEALAAYGQDGATLAELAERVGANKSTIHRTLSTMKSRDFAYQRADGRYELGAAGAALGADFDTEQRLARTLHPALVALSQSANELAHLGILRGGQIIYLDKVEPERAIRVWSRVGQRVNVANSSLGRAILAADGSTDEQVAAYALHLENSTATDGQRVVEAVRVARKRGYSTEVEENEPGVACLGVALMRDDGVAAAISLTSMADRMTPPRQTELAAMIRRLLPPLLPAGIELFLGHDDRRA